VDGGTKIVIDLQHILKITLGVSWGAANLLRSYYRGTVGDGNLDIKYEQDAPVTIADLAVSEYILSRLQAAFGQERFGYICEETYKNQPGQHPAELVWIIDPLDGTRDFIGKTGEYALHIALVQNNRPILAVVAIPEAEKIYYATKGGGTFMETANGCQQLKVNNNRPIQDLILVVTRSHRNEKLEYLLANLPCKQQKTIGSVGCKVTAIVEAQADVYISLSGQSAPKDWDIAAPELILTEAGGKFTHLDGSSLKYNTGDVNQWGCLLASNFPEHEILSQKVKEILTEFVT
jgi:3'(2'), 5'-bisphosphate nucleotidase